MTICRERGAHERPSSNRASTSGYHPAPTRKMTGMFAVTLGRGGTVTIWTVPAIVPGYLIENMMKFALWNGGTVERSRARYVCACVREYSYTRACAAGELYRSIVPSFQRVISIGVFNWLEVERRWNGSGCNRSTRGKAVKYWGETR